MLTIMDITSLQLLFSIPIFALLVRNTDVFGNFILGFTSTTSTDLRFTISASIILVLLLCVLAYLATKKPNNFPPGPKWLPLVGSSGYLQRMRGKYGMQHVTFDAIAKQYASPIFGLKLGGTNVIVASSYDVIHDILTREEFEARPDNFFVRLRSVGGMRGITFGDGAYWRELRGFTITQLRNLGFGKYSMEANIVGELQDITTEMLAGPGGKVENVGDIFMMSILNLMWSLLAGHRFPKDDDRMTRIVGFMKERGKAFDMAGGMLSQFPWLRFVAPERCGYNLMMRINEQWTDMMMDTIREHRVSYSPDETRDLIDAYLHKIDAVPEGVPSNFTVPQLVMVCLDLFVAGLGNTANTLSYVFLMMIHHPDVQQQVQEEIDRVIGRKRLPAQDDENSLPYTEAVIMETMRMHYTLPVAASRRALRDTTLHGFDIPKNSTVLTNLWSLHMDKEHWGDPENFRPSRFIDSNGELKPDKWLLAFSLGRRRCFGESLAKTCIFIFFAGILQKFTVSSVPGSPLPSTTTPGPGLTMAPQPYSAVFQSR